MVRRSLILALTVLVNMVLTSPSRAALTHLYTFNDGTVNDTAAGGTAHGTIVSNRATPAAVVAGQLLLNNPNFSGPSNLSNWLALPPSILPTTGSATIMQWFTFGGSGFFTESWAFSNGADDTNPPTQTNGQYLMNTISNPQGGPTPAGGGSSVAQTLTGWGGGAETRAYGTTPGIGAGGGGYLDDGGKYMTATVIDGTAGTLSYYVYRVSDGVGGLQSSIPAIPLSSYAFTNVYLGRSPFPGDNSTNGSIDEFRIYDEARTAAQIAADFTAGPAGGGPKLQINRSTGVISFTNSSTQVAIFQYTLSSASGAFNTTNITPITGRVDQAGTGTFDNNDNWQVDSNTATSIIESDTIGQGAEDGGKIGSVTLSNNNGWIKSYREDVTATVQIFDGTNYSNLTVPVEFTGNGNAAFHKADLNTDGVVNGSDWTVFRSHHLLPVDQMLTIAQTFSLGDIDGDKTVGLADFRLFKNDYIAVNGPGAWAALSGVPEPTAIGLAAMAAATIVARRRKLSLKGRGLGMLCAAVAALLPVASANAALTHKYTFNDGTANDSAGTANGTLTNGAAVTLGGQAALDGTNDFVDLPGAAIAINTYQDVTIEGWFTLNGTAGWQRLFDFGNTNGGGQGANYLFYSPTSGANDNRAALTNSDPGGGQEDLAIGGAPLVTNRKYHVAVVVDQTTTQTMRLYIDGALATGTNPVALTRNLAGLSNTFAYLGKSVWPDPTLNGYIDEFRIYNEARTATQVASDYTTGPDLANTLALTVNTVTGGVTMQNTSTSALSFDYYSITSSAGQLKPANGSWNSLDDQNTDSLGSNPGQNWDESAGISANVLSELFLRGASTLGPGASLNLGSAFNTALGAGDLKFNFTLTTGELITGAVNYVSATVDADFNNDNIVNGSDFLVWQRNNGVGTGATNATGDSNADGAVNAADLGNWKSRYGLASAVVAANGVPEPATIVLAVFGLGAAAALRRR